MLKFGDLVSTLLNLDSMKFGERWSELFFILEAVCYLSGKMDPVIGGQLLAARNAWNCGGVVYNATGVAMVEEKLQDYFQGSC